MLDEKLEVFGVVDHGRVVHGAAAETVADVEIGDVFQYIPK